MHCPNCYTNYVNPCYSLPSAVEIVKDRQVGSGEVLTSNKHSLIINSLWTNLFNYGCVVRFDSLVSREQWGYWGSLNKHYSVFDDRKEHWGWLKLSGVSDSRKFKAAKLINRFEIPQEVGSPHPAIQGWNSGVGTRECGSRGETCEKSSDSQWLQEVVVSDPKKKVREEANET